MVKFILILVSFLIAFIVKINADKRCQIPTNFKSILLEKNEKIETSAIWKLFYDHNNKMIRTIGETLVGTIKDEVDYLFMYDKDIEYKYSTREKKCFKRSIGLEWEGFGDLNIPKVATYFDNVFIGSPEIENGHLELTTWIATLNGPNNEKLNYTGFYTVNGCVPVILSYESKQNSYEAHFFNVTSGSHDSNTFDIREECKGL